MSTKQSRDLLLLQVDSALANWREARLPSRPSQGWIRTIRMALRMSATALARRLQVTEASVRKFENAEANDAITLGTLRRVADALGCELQYALVPRRPLESELLDQARRAVSADLEPVAHSMVLEGQGVDTKHRQRHIDMLARALLAKGPSRSLW